MARGRRGSQGPSLLIPMIVVIVAWLGLTYYAYHLADENKIAREAYAKARHDLMETTVRHNTNRKELELMSSVVGFTGNAKTANLLNILFLRSQVKNREYQIFTADPSVNLDAVDVRTINLRGQSPQIINGFTRSTQALDTVTDLDDIIRMQDRIINEFVEANQRLQQAIVNTHKLTDEKHIEERRETRSLVRARDTAIENQRQQLNSTVRGTDDAETQHAAKAREANQFFSDFGRRPDLLERQAELRELRKQEDLQRRAINREVEDLLELLPDTLAPVTTRNHYDGTVLFVDVENRWAYINLGSKDMVTPGMTFNVVRYQHSEQPLQIAILQIKRVLTERTAWCDIVTTLDTSVDVRVGDRIVDPGYFREPHPKRFALVGNFGAHFSDYSREETRRMLEAAGFIVEPEVTRFTEVVVLGADFRDDPQFKSIMEEGGALYAGRTAFLFWRPAEVNYFLGRSR